MNKLKMPGFASASPLFLFHKIFVWMASESEDIPQFLSSSDPDPVVSDWGGFESSDTFRASSTSILDSESDVISVDAKTSTRSNQPTLSLSETITMVDDISEDSSSSAKDTLLLRYCITIHGFKTFKTTIKLPVFDGLTAIAAPNGIGKSNLIESFCFVLAARPRLLRVDKLQKLITRGSDRALVSIWIPPNSRFTRTVRTDRSGSTFYFKEDSSHYLDVLDDIGSMITRSEYVQRLPKSLQLLPKLVIRQNHNKIGPKELLELVENASGIEELKTQEFDIERELVNTNEEVQAEKTRLSLVSTQIDDLLPKVDMLVKTRRLVQKRERQLISNRAYLKTASDSLSVILSHTAQILERELGELKDELVQIQTARDQYRIRLSAYRRFEIDFDKAQKISTRLQSQIAKAKASLDSRRTELSHMEENQIDSESISDQDFKSIQERVRTTQTQIRDINYKISRTKSRIQFLRTRIPVCEPILESATPSQPSRVCDIFTVEKQYRPAVLSILGSRCFWFVFPDLASGEDYISKNKHRGRINALYLDDADQTSQVSSDNMSRFLVPKKPNSRMDALAQRLLGRFRLVQNSSHALREIVGSDLSLVTLDGIVFRRDGEISKTNPHREDPWEITDTLSKRDVSGSISCEDMTDLNYQISIAETELKGLLNDKTDRSSKLRSLKKSLRGLQKFSPSQIQITRKVIDEMALHLDGLVTNLADVSIPTEPTAPGTITPLGTLPDKIRILEQRKQTIIQTRVQDTSSRLVVTLICEVSSDVSGVTPNDRPDLNSVLEDLDKRLNLEDWFFIKSKLEDEVQNRSLEVQNAIHAFDKSKKALETIDPNLEGDLSKAESAKDEMTSTISKLSKRCKSMSIEISRIKKLRFDNLNDVIPRLNEFLHLYLSGILPGAVALLSLPASVDFQGLSFSVRPAPGRVWTPLDSLSGGQAAACRLALLLALADPGDDTDCQGGLLLLDESDAALAQAAAARAAAVLGSSSRVVVAVSLRPYLARCARRVWALWGDGVWPVESVATKATDVTVDEHIE